MAIALISSTFTSPAFGWVGNAFGVVSDTTEPEVSEVFTDTAQSESDDNEE